MSTTAALALALRNPKARRSLNFKQRDVLRSLRLDVPIETLSVPPPDGVGWRGDARPSPTSRQPSLFSFDDRSGPFRRGSV